MMPFDKCSFIDISVNLNLSSCGKKKWTDFPIILYTSCHQWWKDDSDEENIKHSTREYLFIDEIYILILIIHYQKINSRIQFRQKFKEFF